MQKFTMYSVMFKKVIEDKANDKKTEFISFGFPFFLQSDKEAVSVVFKTLAEQFKDKDKPDLKDYYLYKVGTWTPESATPMSARMRFVGNLAELAEKHGGDHE